MLAKMLGENVGTAVTTQQVVSTQQWLEVTKLLPSLLWFAFVVVLIWRLFPVIRRDLIPRLSGVKAFGIELTFVRVQLDLAIEAHGLVKEVSEGDRVQAVRRAAAASRALAGMRVLWVDDHPENNRREVVLLNSFGILVDQVISSDEAFRQLRATKYDVVISDIERNGDATAGLGMAAEMSVRNSYVWTVFYVREIDRSRGAPPHAFGITNRPDHLLHFVIDIAERERL